MVTRLALLPIVAMALVTGCASSSGAVEASNDELNLETRTFAVEASGDGCKFQYETLYVKRGGKVTFDNGSNIPSSDEVTSDDNLTIFVDWPDALGDDGGNVVDVTIGTKESVTVPYLDDSLFGSSNSLDFDVHCYSFVHKPTDGAYGKTQAKVRIYR